MASNGQKGKSREQIAQEAHDRAVAKAEKTRARLEAAKEARAEKTGKKKEKAIAAYHKALLQMERAFGLPLGSLDRKQG